MKYHVSSYAVGTPSSIATIAKATIPYMSSYTLMYQVVFSSIIVLKAITIGAAALTASLQASTKALNQNSLFGNTLTGEKVTC